MKRLIKIAGALGILFILPSCDIINPEEEVPSYIHVPAAEVQTTSNKQGASTDNISDVWVYKEGEYLGTYEIPANIPILEKGNQEIEFIAGIEQNGISTTRAQYPFYNSVTKTIELTPKEVDTISPTFQYQDNRKFPFVEDFEDSNGFFDLNRITNDQNIRYGNGAGYLHIPASSDTTYYFETKDPFEVPGEGAPVFVEIDYKSDVDITAGVRLLRGTESADDYKINISNREEWNKIYINYTPEVSKSRADKIKILFKVTINKINEDADMYVDNIKLLY